MKFWKTGVLGLLTFILLPGAVWADEVVQSFASSQTLQPGLIVALDKAQTRAVKPAVYGQEDQIYGVVVDPSDAPLTLNSQNGQVFVTTSGTYNVLVSTANGAIKQGDYISLAPTSGIGAKAKSGQSTVLGRAEGSFDGSSGVITTGGGAAIGRLPVAIAIQANPLNSNTVPAFIKRAADGVADQPVSAVRIYAALAILLAAVAAGVSILWSGIKSSLVSLGRNPLSKRTILGGLYRVIFTGLGVFILGLAGVYLVLKL